MDSRNDCCLIHVQASTGTLRKFMGILDILLSMVEAILMPSQLVCHVAVSPLQIVRAMAQHRSQWVWWVLALCGSNGYESTRACMSGSMTDTKGCRVRGLHARRYRKLFIVFSRYTYVNTLHRLRV